MQEIYKIWLHDFKLKKKLVFLLTYQSDLVQLKPNTSVHPSLQSAALGEQCSVTETKMRGRTDVAFRDG